LANCSKLIRVFGVDITTRAHHFKWKIVTAASAKLPMNQRHCGS